MTKDKFKSFAAKQIDYEMSLIENKGDEYTRGTKDQFLNFKSIAEELNVSPIKVWYVYFKKHIDSITSYVKFGKVKSNESIQSRFTDARNYLLLGLALLEDTNEKNKS